MATAVHIKAFISAHYDADEERFFTTALQISAWEAQHGHDSVAREIRELVDKLRATPKPAFALSQFNQEKNDMIVLSNNRQALSALVASEDLKGRLERIVAEYRNRRRLEEFGLRHRRKILLAGPPGTGKTMTAAAIADKLQIPLYIILVDRILTKYMGESSMKLRQVFDFIRQNRGVYLFDEFDAIGADRGLGNDVGEMRRFLNSFLQFIEQEDSDNLVIAATNNIQLLDQALFRRFDDVLYYPMPSEDDASLIIQNCLQKFLGDISPKSFKEECQGLSHAEITLACLDAQKEAILAEKEVIDRAVLIQMLRERHTIYQKSQRINDCEK